MSGTSEEQAVRTALRARFLHLISRLAGKDCTIDMYEQAKVACKMVACDSAFNNVLVEGLETPAKIVLDSAVLRTEDIISMQFIVDDNSKLFNQ